MNWLFTQAHHRVRSEVDEPFCHLFPIQREQLEGISPVLRKLSEDPELENEHKLWSASCGSFGADLTRPASQAAQDEWQEIYFRGRSSTEKPAPDGHVSRLRLRKFKPRVTPDRCPLAQPA
jgi:hypothetical protein